MIISIITICLNNYIGLKQTRESVLMQSNNNYEHIIVDGGSTDQTKEYLSSINDERSVVVVGKDDGRSDAFNRGIRLSKGDYIICLNGGDRFIDENVVGDVLLDLEQNRTDVLICSVQFEDGYVLKCSGEEGWNRGDLPHQGLFIHRSVYDRVGYYNIALHNRMDYDFCYRMAQERINYRIINRIVAIFDLGGITFFNKKNYELEGIGLRLIYDKSISCKEIDDLKQLLEYDKEGGRFLTGPNKKRIDRIEYQNTILSKWIISIIDGKREMDFFQSRGINTVAVYGMGLLGRLFVKRMKDKGIIQYAIDRNASSISSDIRIIDPDEYLDDGNAIVITLANDRYKINEEMRNKTKSPILLLEEIIGGM